MIIEKQPLQLAPVSIDQIKITNEMIGLRKRKNLKLTLNQLEMLEQIAKKKSIAEITQHFLQNNILISFLAFRDLLAFLADEDLLLNKDIKSYFEEAEPESKSIIDEFIDKLTGNEEPTPNLQQQLQNIPFFRSLEKEVQSIFLANLKVVDTPASIAICRQGQLQRSLYALIKGEAIVYKKDSRGKAHRIATLSEGSIFGETGFFLGEPRTADVITSQKCTVVRFKYLPELFENAIQKETAKALQKRFWSIHALLKSEVFRELPQDCFDALLFAGTPKIFNPDQVICAENEEGRTCYLVVQGKLVVTKRGKSIRVLGQGDCFGEMALILNQGKRTATVKAQTEVVAMEIPSEKFYKLLSENLWLACEFERIALERWQKDRERD